MKKFLLLVLVSVVVSRASAQEDETITEEKSSAWLKVTASVPARTATRTPASQQQRAPQQRPTPRTATLKPKTTTVQKKTEPKPVQQAKPADPFSNTNNQVKRFKNKTNG